MAHEIRDMERHLQNTWQWDKWGFTKEWGACTLSDFDGFFGYVAERRKKFLVIEMKHWNGQGECPKINPNSGQMRALRELAKTGKFTIVLGFGDTLAQTVWAYEIWEGNETLKSDLAFPDYLTGWFRKASGE